VNQKGLGSNNQIKQNDLKIKKEVFNLFGLDIPQIEASLLGRGVQILPCKCSSFHLILLNLYLIICSVLTLFCTELLKIKSKMHCHVN